MLIDFRVKNFRSFRDQVIFSMEAEASKLKLQNVVDINFSNNNEIRLLKLAMIYGANASGKSTLIRAFFNLINYIVRKPPVGSIITMYDPFIFDKQYAGSNSEFELNFVGPQNVKYNYVIIFNQDQIIREELNYYPKGKIANMFTRESKHPSNSSNIEIGVLGDDFGKKEIKVFSNQLLLSKFGDDEPIEELTNVFLYFKKYEIINATSHHHRKKLEKDINEEMVRNKDLSIKMSSLIRFADTKLKELNVIKINDRDIPENIQVSIKERLNNNPFLVFGIHKLYNNSIETGETHSLPFDEESIGTQVLYGLGGKVILALQNGGVLVIDELETSLHPFITQMILLMFQSDKLNPLSAQLIFTSHDVTLLDRDLVRRDQVWIAEKNQDGSSEIFSLQDFDGIREETPFDKWYLAGKFGGLPTLKSIDSMFEDEPFV